MSEANELRNIEVREIGEKATWESFLITHSYKSFLQSWAWGDFQGNGLGKKIWRLGFYEKDVLVGVCLCIDELYPPIGRLIYCPRGPVVNWQDNELLLTVLSKLKSFFANKGYICLRIDPALIDSNDSKAVLKNEGFRDGIGSIQVERAWILDLDAKSDSEILKGMRKNSRYYLKKAMNAGLKVRVSDNEGDFKIFFDMLESMSHRKGFVAFPGTYLKTEFEFLKKSGILKVIIAEHNEKPVASAMIAFYGDESSYLHAASSIENGELQAPYLLQWESFHFAQQNGIKRYNFWGVVEDKNYHPGHPGFGYSNFKKGFGGFLEKYVRAQEFPYSVVKYRLLRLKEIYRKKRYGTG